MKKLLFACVLLATPAYAQTFPPTTRAEFDRYYQQTINDMSALGVPVEENCFSTPHYCTHSMTSFRNNVWAWAVYALRDTGINDEVVCFSSAQDMKGGVRYCAYSNGVVNIQGIGVDGNWVIMSTIRDGYPNG